MRCCADAAPSPAAVATPPPTTPPVVTPAPPGGAAVPVREHFNINGDFTLVADKITYGGGPKGPQRLHAQGAVEMKLKELGMTGKPMTLTFDAANLLMDDTQIPPGKPRKKDLSKAILIQNATLTTCTKPVGHHDYELRAKTFILYPDKTYEARHVAVSMLVLGHRVTLPSPIPVIRGSLASDQQEVAHPILPEIGKSAVDGNFVGINYKEAIGETSTLAMTSRFGTNRLFRGGLIYSAPFDLGAGAGHGLYSVVTTLHEDVQNRLISTDEYIDPRLANLTISRFPAVQAMLTNTPVPIQGLQGFTYRAGVGAGRYTEDPTGVTANRAQLWGVVGSPHYPLGPLRIYGEVGMAGAFYSDTNDTHETIAAQLTLETPASSDFYGNLSLLHRSEAGSTPFLFDRVLTPDDLFTEAEFPLRKKTPWRLDLANYEDLSVGKSADFMVTAIYAEDCLSYGLTYDLADTGIGFKMIINGMETFHKANQGIGFTQ
jgi:hypothetical protein